MFSLIGQSSASMMMSCDMMNMSDMPMSHEMMTSDHDMAMNMPMMNDESSTNMMSDCCQENCDCATASCNPSSATNGLASLTVAPLQQENIRLNIALPQVQFLSYLFKPPIS